MSDSGQSAHACPSCGGSLEEGFNYCPRCGHTVRPTCPACHASLRDEWSWCPVCGQRTSSQTLQIPTRVMAGQAETEAPPAVKSTAEDHNQRGVELYENERYDEAVDQFKKALALDPGNSLYHCNLAVAYGERGDVSEAFSEYQRALSLNPADLTSLLNLGYAYEQQGETEKARREWQKLVDAAPLSAEADEARENLTSLEP